MTDAALLTAGALVAEATLALGAAGVLRPAREAWWIWEEVSGVGRLASVTGSAPPSASQVSAVRSAVDRRLRGEPLAYVLGTAAFRGLVLASDHRALIPRPETEGLVDLAMAVCPSGCAADIGTGTGCIARSLAAEGRYRLVVAIERSREALALARANLRESGVRLVAGDLATALGRGSMDLVVSNPPYLSEEEYALLPDEVRAWEPAQALRSGVDGLTATRALLVEALQVVRPGGWIVLEIDSGRAATAATLASAAGWSDVEVKDDLFGRARYLAARRSNDHDVG